MQNKTYQTWFTETNPPDDDYVTIDVTRLSDLCQDLCKHCRGPAEVKLLSGGRGQLRPAEFKHLRCDGAAHESPSGFGCCCSMCRPDSFRAANDDPKIAPRGVRGVGDIPF